MLQTGFPVHKVQAGEGMAEGLGLTITDKLELRVTDEKMRRLVLATEALVISAWAAPRLLSRLLGQWTWAMLLHRCALPIFHQAIHFCRHTKTGTRGRSFGCRCSTSCRR